MTALNQPTEGFAALTKYSSAMKSLESAVDLRTMPTFCSPAEEPGTEMRLTWITACARELLDVLATLPPMRPKALSGDCVELTLQGQMNTRTQPVEPVWINLEDCDSTCPMGTSGVIVHWVATINGVAYEIEVRVAARALRYWTLIEQSVIVSQSFADGDSSQVMGFYRTSEDPLAFPSALRFLRETLFD